MENSLECNEGQLPENKQCVEMIIEKYLSSNKKRLPENKQCVEAVCKKHISSKDHNAVDPLAKLPKLLPNVDLMFPSILNFLKKYTYNISQYLALVEEETSEWKNKERQNERLSMRRKDFPYANVEKLTFYLEKCRENHERIEDFLYGLSHYVDFRFHSLKVAKVNIKLILDKIQEELEALECDHSSRKNSSKKYLYKLRTPGELPALNTDPESFFFILKSLFKNSVSRGKANLKKLIIHFNAEKDSEGISCYIQDNGREISSEEKNNFFSLFTGKKNLGSNNMEVAIASQYAQMLGGKIWIASSTPTKTLIRLYIPEMGI